MSELADPRAEYFRRVEALDVDGASDLVVQLLDEGMPVERITTEVLAPAQVRVGQLWEAGRWSVADEHVATSVTEGSLSALTLAARSRRGTPTRHVAVACAEGEWHSLPARMAATVAGASGQARVTMLGPSLPADQLRRRLSLGDIDVLALSCTIPTNLIGAARGIAAAHDLDVPVIVGGLAFGASPHRALAIGADGWAADAEALTGPIPDLVGCSIEIPREVLLLDAADDDLVSPAHDRWMAMSPRHSRRTHHQQALAREDLRLMARFTAAALLTDDPSIAEDLLSRLHDRPGGQVPDPLLTAAARLLAETLEPHSAAGAAILRDAADRVDAGPTEPRHDDADRAVDGMRSELAGDRD